MSVFKNIFGGGSPGKEQRDFWKNIENPEDLQDAIASSFQRKTVIFKHSTRCMISKTVLRNFEREVQSMDKDANFYFLDLISHRDLSSKIAQDLQVTHQSPQLIVIKDGKAIANASHEAISAAMI